MQISTNLRLWELINLILSLILIFGFFVNMGPGTLYSYAWYVLNTLSVCLQLTSLILISIVCHLLKILSSHTRIDQGVPFIEGMARPYTNLKITNDLPACPQIQWHLLYTFVSYSHILKDGGFHIAWSRSVPLA